MSTFSNKKTILQRDSMSLLQPTHETHRMLCGLYGLTDEEIKIVEESVV
jgi:hypothetical protein